ncbi:MAG TPA: penicillin acylase family protein [Terriglobales bacterium]|jgi:penicillin amidase
MKKTVRLSILLLAITCVAQAPSDLESRAKASVSQISGTLKAVGLNAPVQVLRDQWGVAHIYAANQHDLFFAQGFVAAQDRLFQMELWKRSGQGRLAEILGPTALQRDINARRLQYRGDMKAEYESYAPDTKEILEAFTAGINAYIASRAGNPPIEFEIAGFKPEPWKPEDCLNRMAAFSMTGNSFSELAHARMVSAVGVEKASQLFEFDPPVQLDPARGMNFAGLSPDLLKDLIGSDSRIEFPSRAKEGSNNWTIAGALTTTGKPILANDPHRVIAEPSLRYIVHLVAPGWDVIGAGEPALPGVALGHNQNIAWGFTIFGLDQQDLYFEELNPANRLQYKTSKGWRKMRLEKATFAVRGQTNVTVDLKFTNHGPILWENGTRALALRWVGAEPGTAGYLASLSVDRAQNWDEFEATMPRWKVPSENIVYADTEGNIGEHSTGLAPLRKNWTGLLPVPGNGRYEWSGFVPNDKLPHLSNPQAGFIATANHKMIPAGYPYKVGYEWAPRFRIERISETLGSARNNGRKLATEDVEKLQTDVLSLPALELIAILQSVGNNSDDLSQMMLKWDGVLSKDSGPAALYELWMQNLTKELTKRAVPAKQVPLLADWSPARILNDLQHPGQEMFGDKAAAERNQLLHDTLKQAEGQLRTMQGDDPAKWSWGALHQVRFRHSLDHIAGADKLLNPASVARPGDEYTVNATGSTGSSFDQVSGASYREILDTSNWDQSVAINSPGQSGQPGSKHYSDLVPLWSEGKYFPLAYSREAVEKSATDRLTLEP